MSATTVAPEGAWVEIQQVVLAPGERAAGVPPDTAATPLLQWVDGFLTAPAALGEEATIRTIIGADPHRGAEPDQPGILPQLR